MRWNSATRYPETIFLWFCRNIKTSSFAEFIYVEEDSCTRCRRLMTVYFWRWHKARIVRHKECIDAMLTSASWKICTGLGLVCVSSSRSWYNLVQEHAYHECFDAQMTLPRWMSTTWIPNMCFQGKKRLVETFDCFFSDMTEAKETHVFSWQEMPFDNSKLCSYQVEKTLPWVVGIWQGSSGHYLPAMKGYFAVWIS